MRNDARPIGEALRHGHDVDRREDDQDHGDAKPRENVRSGKRYLTDRDPGDEETAMPAPDATVRTKI